MKLQQLIPQEADIELADLMRSIRSGSGTGCKPFSSDVIDFCSHLSELLFNDEESRRYSELQALAFFMRRANLTHLKAEFDRLGSDEILLVPRGVVLHFPPANVDTIAIYSWLLAVLTGNRNIVRVSTRSSQRTHAILRLYRNALSAAHSEMRENTLVVSYGHDAEITAALSSLADVRVIWGGDSSVSAIRAVPMPAHTQELVFPDRYSFCIIESKAFNALEEAERTELARRFFNDMYWFDQRACSSPRLLVWCGDYDDCHSASSVFGENLLAQIEASGYELPIAFALEKMNFVFACAIDQPVGSITRRRNELAIWDVKSLEQFGREHCGLGLLFQYYGPNLAEISKFVRHCDQTMTYFGFTGHDLRHFLRALNGAGIDRAVPIGQALSFHRYWDGYDLLQEFTKKVRIELEIK